MRLYLLPVLLLLAACAPAASTPAGPLVGLPLVADQPNLIFFYTDG
jgi:hypothetical protein